MLCPTGNAGRGLGVGAWGWQFNLPASKQVHDFYFHGNAGLTWYPRVKSVDSRSAGAATAPDVTLTSPFVAASTIYRLKPMLNLMLESVLTWQDAVDGPGQTGDIDRHDPLARVPHWLEHRRRADHRRRGAAFHLQRRHDRHVGVFTYFSYESAVLEGQEAVTRLTTAAISSGRSTRYAAPAQLVGRHLREAESVAHHAGSRPRGARGAKVRHGVADHQRLGSRRPGAIHQREQAVGVRLAAEIAVTANHIVEELAQAKGRAGCARSRRWACW